MVKWEIAPLGNNGNLFFFLDFKVIGPQSDSGEDGVAFSRPESRSLRRALVPRGLDWLMADLRQLGFEGKELARLDPTAPNAHDFSGREFTAVCEYKDSQDGTKTYEEWRLVQARQKASVEQKANTFAALQQLVDVKAGPSTPREGPVTY